MTPTLHGYRYSVYAWIARFAFAAKGVRHDWREVDPFAADIPADYLALHPFGRVPALTHGTFTLYETAAITRYVEEAFEGPPLLPDGAQARARTAQIVSMVDAYVYWPLVRQVYSDGAFARRTGRARDAAAYAAGLEAAPGVLGALEALAGEAFLIGRTLTLADIHLAPMIACFVDPESPDGAPQHLLARHGRLAAWFARLSAHPAFVATRPDLPGGSGRRQSTG